MLKFTPSLKLAFGCAIILSGMPSADAQEVTEPEKIIRVEEDWIAYIKNPDADAGAPQLTNVIAPIRSTDSVFGLVELNHRSAPGFNNGGYQVQGWVGNVKNDYQSSVEVRPFRNSYDKLVYTVAMEMADSKISFELLKGKSRTWGSFAKDGVKAIMPAYNLNLDEYDPQFSVDNTSINVGAHRVALMYQRRVRYYSANGLVRTDTTPRVLHRFKSVVEFVSLDEYEQNEAYFNIEITE